ncbi:MAG: hypothetical protein ACKO85_13760 [Isosphaeraceae bacterium]
MEPLGKIAGSNLERGPGEISFVRNLGSPGRRISTALAGCPLDDGTDSDFIPGLSAFF